MRVRIFQLPSDSPLVFSGYLDTLGGKQEAEVIRPSNYRTVFDGECPENGLEDLYVRFNVQSVPNHYGRSMSVSDIVQVIDDSSGAIAPGCYFCDIIGFKQISSFDPDAVPPIEDGIRAVCVEPGLPAYAVVVKNNYSAFSKMIGGPVERFPIDDNVLILCDEDAKLKGRSGCRRIGNTVIAGTFLVVARDEHANETGLTDEQMDTYLRRFSEPENISDREVRENMTIRFIPID